MIKLFVIFLFIRDTLAYWWIGFRKVFTVLLCPQVDPLARAAVLPKPYQVHSHVLHISLSSTVNHSSSIVARPSGSSVDKVEDFQSCAALPGGSRRLMMQLQMTGVW